MEKADEDGSGSGSRTIALRDAKPGASGPLMFAGGFVTPGYYNPESRKIEGKDTRDIALQDGQCRFFTTSDRIEIAHERDRNGLYLMKFLGREDLKIKLKGEMVDLGERKDRIEFLKGVEEVEVIKFADIHQEHTNEFHFFVVCNSRKHSRDDRRPENLVENCAPPKTVRNIMDCIPAAPNIKVHLLAESLPRKVTTSKVDREELRQHFNAFDASFPLWTEDDFAHHDCRKESPSSAGISWLGQPATLSPDVGGVGADSPVGYLLRSCGTGLKRAVVGVCSCCGGSHLGAVIGKFVDSIFGHAASFFDGSRKRAGGVGQGATSAGSVPPVPANPYTEHAETQFEARLTLYDALWPLLWLTGLLIAAVLGCFVGVPRPYFLAAPDEEMILLVEEPTTFRWTVGAVVTSADTSSWSSVAARTVISRMFFGLVDFISGCFPFLGHELFWDLLTAVVVLPFLWRFILVRFPTGICEMDWLPHGDAHYTLKMKAR